MTKEEIESKLEDLFDANTSPTGGGYEADYTDKRAVIEGFLYIAEQYAQQQAIAFLEDIRSYESQSRNLICFDERTSEELYQIFQKTTITN